MDRSTKFAATILRASANAYGSAAASILMERNPDVEGHFGPQGWGAWRTHLTQRVLELAAAVAAGTPEIFVDRIQWTRKAFVARGVPEEDLLASINSLRQALETETPAAVREAAMPALAAAAQALDAELPPDLRGLSPDTGDGRLALDYLLSALEGDGHRAMQRILDVAADGRSAQDLLLNVLLPVQCELGALWHGGELGIAQEHYVTALTERVMAVLASNSEAAPPNGRAVLLATVSGDTHAIGIRTLSYLFELAGWRAVYLGADLPDTDIAAAAEYFAVDLILLSATLTTSLSAVESAISTIRENDDRHRPIIVGGLAYTGAQQLWQTQGADGYGDTAEKTLALADELTRTA